MACRSNRGLRGEQCTQTDFNGKHIQKAKDVAKPRKCRQSVQLKLSHGKNGNSKHTDFKGDSI